MKDPVKRNKGKATIWGKIFPNHISDKELISRLYKEFSKFNGKEIKHPIKKMGKRYEEIFHHRGCRDGQ